MDEWTDKNGDVYKLDTDAPEGVVRYLLSSKAKKPKKASTKKKAGLSERKSNTCQVFKK